MNTVNTITQATHYFQISRVFDPSPLKASAQNDLIPNAELGQTEAGRASRSNRARTSDEGTHTARTLSPQLANRW
jgi:hypothetical protein